MWTSSIVSILLCSIILVESNPYNMGLARARLNLINRLRGEKEVTARCANLLDEGCSSGSIPGSGVDSGWLGSASAPGKRACLNAMDEGCANGGLPQSGVDSGWLGSSSTPGKRACLNAMDEGCANGGIPQSGVDSGWLLDGTYNPGKRSCIFNVLDESCANNGALQSGVDSGWLGSGGNPGKRSLRDMREEEIIHLLRKFFTDLGSSDLSYIEKRSLLDFIKSKLE